MRTCKRCNETKRLAGYPKQGSQVCSKCRYKENMDKERLFLLKDDLGIEVLDKEKEIKVIAKYVRPTRIMNYDQAIALVADKSFKVLDNETIYLMEFLQAEKEDLPTRINVLERDKWECHYCGGDAATVDHVIPKSKGGGFTEENLVTSCSLCNGAKSDRILTREEILREAEKLKRSQKIRAKKKRKAKKESEQKVEIIENINPAKPTLEDMIRNTLSSKKQKWE